MTVDTLDTVGRITTSTSIGGAVMGEFSPHPLQLWVWGIAAVSGLVAIALGCVRIYVTVKNASNE